MIKAEEVISSVMSEFNSMDKAEKRAYLDHIGLKYTFNESGKARENMKIKKIAGKRPRGGKLQSAQVSAKKA